VVEWGQKQQGDCRKRRHPGWENANRRTNCYKSGQRGCFNRCPGAKAKFLAPPLDIQTDQPPPLTRIQCKRLASDPCSTPTASPRRPHLPRKLGGCSPPRGRIDDKGAFVY
ncbi:hypothetical protein NQ315_009994, partial [Exocentrus adspersus]